MLVILQSNVFILATPTQVIPIGVDVSYVYNTILRKFYNRFELMLCRISEFHVRSEKIWQQ